MARTKKYTEEVLTAFLESKSIREAQERTGLSRTTINKYRADPQFQEELAKRKLKAVKAALAKMQMGLTAVAEAVLDIAMDEGISPQIRLNACQVALSQCRSWTHEVDVLERLEAVEKSLRAMDEKCAK